MHLAQMIDTLDWGGAQKMQLFLVQALVPLGIDVTVISLNQSLDSPLPAQLKAAGARVMIFPFPRLLSLQSFLRLAAFMRREKFDLLHAYLAYGNIIGSLVGRLSSTPVFGSFRNAGYDPQRMTARRIKLETFCLQHFTQGIIANGYAVAEYGRKQVGNSIPIDILPNAIDANAKPSLSNAERRTLRQQIASDPDRTIILSVGRLTPQKGFPNLLRAYASVLQAHPNTALVIAGGGISQGDLEEEIHRLGLDGHAFLLGQYNDVPRLLAVADIYANSSIIEGTPVSLLEAMSAGLPIAATAVGDTPYILDNTSAILVPAEHPEELAEALSALIASPERRCQLGRAARERVERNYSPKPWTRNLLQLYSKLAPQAADYLAKI